ncbi:hypothetical protein O181_035881 [Austropuccinia psidii MF-1]|uniref:Integrase catalytic domain-containing protein n=1 Tax=Austropuccinia psidii MF-1 TaxID=1389203 RepID=A0A9Q3H9D5_9BASI|nr:hypothetical protein [Austropuccinia psidii MF-1]
MGPEAQNGSAAARNGIPMLSDNNYADWDASIRAYFLLIGFLDYVNGDMSPPAEDRGDLHLKYCEQKQKAAGVICQSLNTNKHAKFLKRNNEKDPIALYNVIINYYQSNQSTNQARVFCNLLSINCKDNEINNFISKIRIQLMYMNSVGIRVGNHTASSVVDISDELLAEIIVSKLSQGYDGLKRLIYEQRPLLTDKIIEKIDDYIRDSGNTSNTSSNHIKSESAFFNKRRPFCKNGEHNPLTKRLAKDCHQIKKKKGKKSSPDKSEKVKHTETTQFKESDSSDNESHLVKFSKAFKDSSNSSDASIYLDSAASCHMVGSLDLFHNFKKESFKVETADGSYTAALGIGDVSFIYRGKIITLKCIYVPNIKGNLISMGKLWKRGKISPSTIGGGQYYLKFTDDFSKFKTVYILKNKSETCGAIKNYVNQVKTIQKKPVKVMVNDNGGEYLSGEVQDFINKEGIRMEFTAPYSPQQNSASERGNRSTSEKARSLLFNCKLPASFWGEAVVTSVFLENITPSLPAYTKTPFEIWYGKPFDLSRLRSFGCLCFVNIPKVKRHGKFSPTATKGIFLGYDNYKHNYRVMLPNGKITYSHDVIFDEEKFPWPPSEMSIVPSSMANEDYFLTATSSNSSNPMPSVVSEEEATVQKSSLSAPRRPGWDILLTSNIAPKNISSNLDQGNILEDSYEMKSCKPVSTPMVPNSRLQEATEEETKEFEILNINYQQAVGKISYLQVATRGDLAFVTSQLSQYLVKPGIKHWLAFKHLLQYLQGKKHLMLRLGGMSLSLSVFCDADFANCNGTRKSISGFMMKVGDFCITWKSKKQSTVSTLSCEAEYKAQYEGGKEEIWTGILLKDLGVVIVYTLEVCADNQGANALAGNSQITDRNKHFDIIFHWTQEQIRKNKLRLSYIPSQEMPADGLTKALVKPAHLRFATNLGLVDPKSGGGY